MNIDIKQTATYHEITNQTRAWEGALQAYARAEPGLQQFWNAGGFGEVLFSGCGSTYYLSLAAASLFQQLTGWRGRAVPAGELFMYPGSAYVKNAGTLLVAVSRSGKTTETITAVEQFKSNKLGKVIVITNDGESPLAGMGDVTLSIPEGMEESMAQTRSFSSMYLATTALSACFSGQPGLIEAMHALPQIGDDLVAAHEDLAIEFGGRLVFDRYYFLGSGPRYGLACETNLKMKEMSLTHSEPFHFMEFRHGPVAMVTDTTVIVGLLSQSRYGYEQAVLDEMARLGGHVLSLGETGAVVPFNSQLPESIQNVLYLPVLQLMACYRAAAKGYNPDQPKNLTAVIQLDFGGE